MYQPKIMTKYTVGGRNYVAHEVHFGESSSWRSNSNYAYDLVNKYPLGSEVTVYYKPDEPSVVVLDTSAQFFSFLIVALGAALVLLGAYLFWLSLRDTYYFMRRLFGKRAA